MVHEDVEPTERAERLLRVLVVEDDPEAGRVFTDFLQELGHQPRLVESAEAALRELGAWRPDAIVLDVRLPGVSGLEFLQADPVRSLGVPVVAVSGVATDAEARECLRLGAIDFLPKPVTLERFSAVLAFLEVGSLRGQLNRRRVPRVSVVIPVQVGAAWQWTAVDLSPFGVKVPPQTWLRPGAQVTLALDLSDGAPPLHVEAAFVRVDPDGHVFHFLNLGGAAFRRLGEFVRRAGR